MKHISTIDNLFKTNKGKVIKYKGRLLRRIDYFVIKKNDQIQITFETTNSKWRQGIIISFDENVFGTMNINGKKFNSPLVFWEDTAPINFIINFECESDGNIKIYNVWDPGDGVTWAWYNGAAMIVEEIPDGYRYRCNDGEPDEDFDDLVFRIERVQPKTVLNKGVRS